MKLTILGTVLFVSTFVSSAPTSNTYIFNNEVVKKSLVKYTGEYDILKIELVFNELYQDDKTNDSVDDLITVYFIEGDIKQNGEHDYKGLYILKNKKAKKIMDNARDVTSERGTNNVFIAASDGLYVFHPEKESPEKYGTITDSFLKVAKPNNTDIVYAINDKYELIKITEGGTKSIKMNDVKNAKEIVLDLKNNLFYMDSNQDVFFVNADGVKKIEGLPDKKTYTTLVKPLFLTDGDGALAFVNDEGYNIHANGGSSSSGVKFEIRPTAYDPSPALIQYFGYDKKIYQLNQVAMTFGEAAGDHINQVLQGVKAFKAANE